MTWVWSVTYKLIDPFVAGTIAIFDVSAPSIEFRVDTCGHGCPCGHKLRNPRLLTGTVVAFKTNAFAKIGIPQALAVMETSFTPVIAGAGNGKRLSNTRQGVTLYSDKPPSPAGAK